MFENILIPISSEFYQKEVFRRSVEIAKTFKSNVDLIYIIEEKTLNQTDKITDSFRTPYDMDETKKQIIRKQISTAGSIIFDDAKSFFDNKNIPFEEKIVKGEFSTIIKNQLTKKNYDLILMGFEKDSVLNYRLLDDVHIPPVWIEARSEGNSILAVCSNLAPNQKVPEIGMKLAHSFGCKLHMVYVIDKQDTVEVDENGERSGKKSKKDLLSNAQNFVESMKELGIDIELVEGSLEKETIKSAKSINANLVIIGREKKKKSNLGIPIKHFKRKIAEKCRSSMLFIN